ncbi:MAG: DUF4367 domain-containing protein [Oscillospiraceae bacterium]|nr:DUF4367 domain-containing protein [Oscillospiraceae bacterium]
MNEDRFREILGKALACEFAEFDSVPEHKFSLKHRFAMKRIFAKYERNVRRIHGAETVISAPAAEGKPIRGLKQRVLFATVIIILMTFLAGCAVAVSVAISHGIFSSKGFQGTVYPNNTHIFAVDTAGCPETIEYEYTLAFVPKGFELVESDRTPEEVYAIYMNHETGQAIVFDQWVKSHYMPRINTEYGTLEEAEINGKAGLYMDFSNGTFIVWDNGDYIIEIEGNLDKDSTMNLANINKI